VGFLLDGVRNRWIDEAALGFDERDSLNAFRNRKALVMRHWPDAWPALAQTSGAIGVTRLPGERSTVLGGESVAVAHCSPHRESARQFLSFLSEAEQQKWVFREGLYLPTVAGLYDDDSLAGFDRGELSPEFVALLRDSIRDARARPAEASYDRTSRLIRTGIHGALERSADEAVDANDVVEQLAGDLD
jgi:multiple sugar transport system substrate-binding protein